ncbi:MAG: hypothetical protein N2V73_01090 [Candidatus Methanospirare jalkutatii]|nr:hypothetical protein [Candidatus Methanospirare jalkutatii]
MGADMTPSLGSAESRNPASNEIVIEVKESKSKIVLEFPKSVGRRVIFFGKQALKIGKEGRIRIKKSSLIGREILKISSKGKKLVLTNNKVVFRPSGSIEKTGSKFIIFRPRTEGETMEEREEKLKLLYNLADRCDNWMANLPEGEQELRERIKRLFSEVLLCISSIENGSENPFIGLPSEDPSEDARKLIELCEIGAAEVENVTIEDERALIKIRYIDTDVLKDIREKSYWQVNNEEEAKLALHLSSKGPFKLVLVPSAYEPFWFKKFYEPSSPNFSQIYHSVSKKIEECKQQGIGGRILQLLEELKIALESKRVI